MTASRLESKRLARRRAMKTAAPLLATLFGLAACGELPEFAASESPERTQLAIENHSTEGCRIDDDCIGDHHCFQALCVRACEADAECSEGFVCSDRGRCVRALDANATDPALAQALRIDASSESELEEALPHIDITELSTQRLSVRSLDDAPELTLQLSQALPPSGLSYVLAYHETGERSPVRTVYGDTSVTIPIPVNGALPERGEAHAVDIVTTAGRVTVHLAQPFPVSGLYDGVSQTATFGGTALPVAFAIETVPADVTQLEDADAAWVWLASDSDQLLHLPARNAEGAWMRAPLEWDSGTQAWVSTFFAGLDGARIFGAPLYPHGQRSIRIELRQSPDEEGHLSGAWVDRWHGIRDRISVDGVPQPLAFAVTGHLLLARDGDLPSVERREALEAPSAWSPLPPPALPHCLNADLQSIYGSPDAPSACQTIGTLADLSLHDPALVAECALDMAAQVDDGAPLANTLHAFLDPNQDNPQGMSFADFLDACAAQDRGFCVPQREQQCARELTAYAYALPHPDADTGLALALQYQELTQSLFLGSKLSAFHSDTQHRLTWLQSTEAPLFLANALKDYNAQILDLWQERVANTLLDALFGQLDDAGMSFLVRASADPTTMALRAETLLDLGVLWRATADAVTLFAQRVNLIEDRDAQRRAAAAQLSHRFFRLYVAGAAIAELGREAGTTAQNTSIGAHLASMDVEIRRLATPFHGLILARSAEVVTSQSVDPSAGNQSLIGELQTLAREAIADAERSVDVVHAESQLNLITEATLRDRYEDQIIALRNELIQLCGLPIGCDASDVGSDPACAIPTAPQACGFITERGSAPLELPAPTTTSEAALVLHDLWAAVEAQRRVEENLNAALSRATLLRQSVEDFQQSLTRRQTLRIEANREISSISAEISRFENGLLRAQLQTIEQQQRIRENAYERQAAAINNWSEILIDGARSDASLIDSANAASRSAQILHFAADRASTAAGYAATAIVDQVGSKRYLGVVPLSIAFATTTAMGIAAQHQNLQADAMEARMEKDALEGAAFSSRLDDMAALQAQRTATDIAALEAEIETLDIQHEEERAGLRSLISAMERSLALDEEGDRDIAELRDRRDALLVELQSLDALSYQVAQAELTVDHQVLSYLDVVQRAQLLHARFESAAQRWSNIETLIGSPDVIFSFANRIALAESRLERARRALEDWVIALEYYAVRPFVSERIAILLARNPQQLEAIANELVRLQQACGGPRSTERVDVSLRDNLLRVNLASLTTDDAGTHVAAPDARFRALLRRANTPVHRRARLNAYESVGERLARGNMLAANFTLSVHDFANLPQSCNAKVESIALQLVGVDAPNTQPVVTLVYDGSSELRSCQADIRELVLAVGPESTAFAPITRFETGARAVSPVAGVEAFGPASTWNATLEGTPLAAGYTLLIDLDHPSNQAVDWEQLEDIRIQFSYSHQDPFPAGQCQ